MSKPVIVSIPHSLGKAEARRRLEVGLGSVRSHFGNVLNVQEEVWSGDSLAFRASVLTQQTTGTITVADDHVRVEVLLPWALAEPVAVGGVDGALLGAGAVAGAADVKAPPPPPPCPGGVGSVLGSALNSAFCTAIRSIPVMAPLPSVSNSGL